MRVLELRALVMAQDYAVDPKLVAEALLRRSRRFQRESVSPPADARSPSGHSPASAR